MALHAVDEDGDGQQVIADGQLAAGEDGPRRDAELVLASLTLPDTASRIGVDRRAFTARAERLAAVVGPTDRLKLSVSLIVRHAEDTGEAQGTGFGGKEEVLCHAPIIRERLRMVKML